MTTIGFIGSGHIGSTVAKLAVDAGYDVVMSNSRGPETLSDVIDTLGPNARAATAEEAAAAGDIVVVTVPLKNYKQVPVEPLAGKLVIDTNNYYPQRDGAIAALDAKETTVSELLAEHLPDSHVVKAFNNIYFGNLATMNRPAGASDRSTLIIAGDDEAAKQRATGFLDALGYDAYDSGALADSWRYERDQPAYVSAYAREGDFSNPTPADADHLKTLLDQADRSIG